MLESFNELCVLLSLYVYMLFTDMVEDYDIKWNAGYILIGITCFNLGVNILIIAMSTLYHFCKALLRILLKNHQVVKKEDIMDSK